VKAKEPSSSASVNRKAQPADDLELDGSDSGGDVRDARKHRPAKEPSGGRESSQGEKHGTQKAADKRGHLGVPSNRVQAEAELEDVVPQDTPKHRKNGDRYGEMKKPADSDHIIDALHASTRKKRARGEGFSDVDLASGLRKPTKRLVQTGLREEIEANEIWGRQKVLAQRAARREEVEYKLGEAASDNAPTGTEKQPSTRLARASWIRTSRQSSGVASERGMKLMVWDDTDDSSESDSDSDVKQKKSAQALRQRGQQGKGSRARNSGPRGSALSYK
jgi:hypothetical protein